MVPGKQTHVLLPDPSSDAGPTVAEQLDRDRYSLAELTDAQRGEAMSRFAVLRPHIEDEVPLTVCASERSVPLRTAQR